MKKMMKKLTAVLLSVMCLALAGCGGAGGAADPRNCKDWTEGVMEINGGVVTLGKTKIDDFMEITGFNQEIKSSDYGDYTYRKVSDGYSTIGITVQADGRVTYLYAREEFDDMKIDTEHTSIVGPGGIEFGVSTVDELAEFDKNLKDRYNSSVQNEEAACCYIAGKSAGGFNMEDGLIYSVVGDPETRVIFEMTLQVE